MGRPLRFAIRGGPIYSPPNSCTASAARSLGRSNMPT